MLETAIIVFREALEAAIIIGIMAAATRNVADSKRWIVAGLLIGLIGSAIVAAFTDAIASFASGVGQELFNAIVLGIAVLMLAWHNIWMSAHGADLAKNASNIGTNIREGRSESSIILVVVGLAVLREGSETVLFLYGIAASNAGDISAMFTGAFIGLSAGVAVCYTLYAGVLLVPIRWFFAATSALVLLLAAGMASTAAHFLIQADLIPSLASPLWDSSSVIPENSITGTLLHSLIGYDARPAGMQVVFYITVLVAIGLGMKFSGKPHKSIQNNGVI
jgi:high-affinity iron transporter